MNLSIIKSFIADQKRAKQIVLERLGVPLNITALDWAIRSPEFRSAYWVDPFADIFEPHGYGLELQIGDFYIDYDYSETGRADGFDSWRLFVYLKAGKFDNRGQDKYMSSKIDNWIENLVSAGLIRKLDNLYYFDP